MALFDGFSMLFVNVAHLCHYCKHAFVSAQCGALRAVVLLIYLVVPVRKFLDVEVSERQCALRITRVIKHFESSRSNRRTSTVL